MSAFNEANIREKILNCKKRIIINRIYNSCRNNLNKYIIIYKCKNNNNNIAPLSDKNKNFKFNLDVINYLNFMKMFFFLKNINFIQNNKKIIKEKKENLNNYINNRDLKISNEMNMTIKKKNLAEKNNENNNNINKDI